MKNLLKTAREFVYSKKIPSGHMLDIATKAGIRLAKELNADLETVEIGTYLMDCMLEDTLKEGRNAPEHVQMSLDKTNELLSESDICEENKENIRQCVLQHHGGVDFHSIESEICCNADCYRWSSVEGVIEGARLFYDMPYEEFLKLANDKINEKWNALTLDICKKELKEEYELLKKMIKLAK